MYIQFPTDIDILDMHKIDNDPQISSGKRKVSPYGCIDIRPWLLSKHLTKFHRDWSIGDKTCLLVS